MPYIRVSEAFQDGFTTRIHARSSHEYPKSNLAASSRGMGTIVLTYDTFGSYVSRAIGPQLGWARGSQRAALQVGPVQSTKKASAMSRSPSVVRICAEVMREASAEAVTPVTVPCTNLTDGHVR